MPTGALRVCLLSLMLVEVSSRNTSRPAHERLASIAPKPAGAAHIGAFALARHQSFFMTEAEPPQPGPDRAYMHRNSALFFKHKARLVQRQLAIIVQPRPHPVRMAHKLALAWIGPGVSAPGCQWVP